MRTNQKLTLALGLATLAAAVVLIPTVALAGDDRPAPARHTRHGRTQDGRTQHGHKQHGRQHSPSLLFDLLRVALATARFHNVDNALAAGYELGWVNGSGIRIITGCVTNVANPAAGAMGYHYFHPGLMADNAVDPLKPEVLVYETGNNGKLRLVAVEWVVRGPNSNPPGVPEGTIPTVLGMDMHILVPPPGPAFFIKHAWIWKYNPSGIFADWNPNVSCP